MICKTEGIVIRGFRMSQTSKVVLLFSREYGKLRLAARGARRPKSKFGASLEPMTWGTYLFYKQENRDLQTLTEGDILYVFEGIKRSYQRVVCASSVCELLDHMTEDEDPNALLFSVALDALRWMETVPEKALEAPLWYFQLKAASALGYRPHLSGCVSCGQRLSGSRAWFSPLLGGTLCENHRQEGMAIKKATVDFMEHLQVHRPDRVDLKQFESVDRVEVNRVLRGFLMHHIESRRRIRSLDFWDRMVAAEAEPAYNPASLERG